MIHFIGTVRFADNAQAFAWVLRVVEETYSIYTDDGVWLTSAADSTHKEGSLHYEGRAWDFRMHNLPHDWRSLVVQQISARLSPTFDVLWEDRDKPNEHLHIEYDPKEPPRLAQHQQHQLSQQQEPHQDQSKS